MDLENNEDCCSVEEKINRNDSSHANHNVDEHSHDNVKNSWKEYYPAIISLVILLSGLTIEHLFKALFFEGWIKIVWYVAAYLPVGLPVLKHAFISLKKGEVFTEFF